METKTKPCSPQDIEQFLDDHNVFLNGINNKPCHMDSYMTVIDFVALDKCFAENSFIKEDWLNASDYWENQVGYLSPTIKLLGIWSKRHADKM